ncbi:MAG: hypothetical protein JW891_04860 [Candidatus Lokiarchaeota archaeon]|nr:hypothetical protein [Candidatus Lokiarchaeota archaeon]
MSGKDSESRKYDFKYEQIEPEQLCEVFLFYFDESLGQILLLKSPEERHTDEETMRILKVHSIWFLDISDKTSLDRVDLEYGMKMYFAKKFLVPSYREKRRAGSKESKNETIVLILALPIEMDIFGAALVKSTTEKMIKHFKHHFTRLIEANIASLDLIKTPKTRELFEEGQRIKKRMSALIKNSCSQYFKSVIQKTDTSTLKIQKAISYLSLRGVPIEHITKKGDKVSFSNMKLFETELKSSTNSVQKSAFSIMDKSIVEETQELEIITKNNSQNHYHNIHVKITSLTEFFEQPILFNTIEDWLPEEELVFSVPKSIGNQDMIFCLLDQNRKVLFQQRIKPN